MKTMSYKKSTDSGRWPQIPCMRTTPDRCSTLPAMVVLDIFVVPINIAATIVDAPPPSRTVSSSS
jgi:hypothetical protein